MKENLISEEETTQSLSSHGRQRLDLPDEILNSWRADCPRFPYEPPCDQCIYDHCNNNNYFIGGIAHGKKVPIDLTYSDRLQIAVPSHADFFSTSSVYEPLSETYIKKLIGFANQEWEGSIAVWVIESLSDPEESFQKFYKFIRLGE